MLVSLKHVMDAHVIARDLSEVRKYTQHSVFVRYE